MKKYDKLPTNVQTKITESLEALDNGDVRQENNFNTEATPSNLKIIREDRNFSQSKLAELSGVSVRMIQHYEQGVKDINKAQADTLYKLSRALGVTIESLLNDMEV